MAAVTGTATSYDLPQYVGELFQKGQKPNAFLRAIGGLTGALRLVGSRSFTMGVDYTLPAGAQPAQLEGAVPPYKELDANQSTNSVQIFQKGVSLTYSAQGDTASLTGSAVIPGLEGQGGAIVNTRSIEFQRARALESLARDVNVSMLTGAFNVGAAGTARGTRGLISAVSTNLFANGGTGRALTRAIFEAALKAMVVGGSINQGDDVWIFAEANQYAALHAAYEVMTAPPRDRNVAGLDIKTLTTPWARANLAFEPDIPTGKLVIAQPQYCRIACMPIPGKGTIFAEPLAKTGSADNEQVYGELGLDYRSEFFHGVIADLS